MSFGIFILRVLFAFVVGLVFCSVMCVVFGWLITLVEPDEPDEYDPLALPPPPQEKGSANDHDLG